MTLRHMDATQGDPALNKQTTLRYPSDLRGF